MDKRTLHAYFASIGATFLLTVLVIGFIYLCIPFPLYTMRLILACAIVGSIILLWYIVHGIFKRLDNNGDN